MTKSADAFRTISEVADDLGIPKHVLRFWEVKFAQIKPMKRGGGRRYYRPADLELLRGIRHLLHREGYTIKGVQKILREQGVEAVKQFSGPEVVDAAAVLKSEGAPPERPKGRRSPKAGAKASGAAGPPDGMVNAAERQRIIRLAIGELEACRGILKGETPRGATAATADLVRRGGAR